MDIQKLLKKQILEADAKKCHECLTNVYRMKSVLSDIGRAIEYNDEAEVVKHCESLQKLPEVNSTDIVHAMKNMTKLEEQLDEFYEELNTHYRKQEGYTVELFFGHRPFLESRELKLQPKDTLYLTAITRIKDLDRKIEQHEQIIKSLKYEEDRLMVELRDINDLSKMEDLKYLQDKLKIFNGNVLIDERRQQITRDKEFIESHKTVFDTYQEKKHEEVVSTFVTVICSECHGRGGITEYNNNGDTIGTFTCGVCGGCGVCSIANTKICDKCGGSMVYLTSDCFYCFRGKCYY